MYVLHNILQVLHNMYLLHTITYVLHSIMYVLHDESIQISEFLHFYQLFKNWHAPFQILTNL
jgi:hypothetical protein